jgi:hypothetical protein
VKFSHLQVFRSPKTGKYRVMIVGQPDAHIMDWRGCNFRRMTLPTPLKKTFDRAADAKAYEEKLEKENSAQLVKFAAFCGDGSWFDQREGVYDLDFMPDAPSKGWLKNECTGCHKQLQAFSKTCGYCGAPMTKVLESDVNKVM